MTSTLPPVHGDPAAPVPRLSKLDEQTWWILVAWVLIVGVTLRFFMLDLKPLHHDEGVNGMFLTNMIRSPGTYRYDPANYHGPTLYFLAQASAALFGVNTFAIRFVPALFGAITICLALSLRRYLGAVGALAAAALISLSPGAVYISRYFIHESLLVCFTLAAVVASARFLEDGRVRNLVAASASVGLMFATKETAVIAVVTSLGALVTASLLTAGWRPRAWPGGRRLLTLSLAAIVPFVVVNVVFYSSLFTHWDGVRDALTSFAPWLKTGTKAHLRPWFTYLVWLWQEESPVLLLGALGVGWALLRRENPFVVFAGLWAVALLVAYSCVPYKTPWLTLNLIVPLAVAAGYGVEAIHRAGARIPKRLAAASVASLVCIAIYQTVVLNFLRYDDDRYPYVYAHTRREFLELVAAIHQVADRSDTLAPLTIAVTSPEHFPLSWYLRDYPAGFYGHVVPTKDSIVIGSTRQERELEKTLGFDYRRINSYALRPGVRLVLFVRQDLADR